MMPLRAGLRAPAIVVVIFGACLFGAALSLPLLNTSLNESPSSHPSWVVGNLTFPFGNVTGEGTDGFPTYTGNNEAEACPTPLLFTCDKCHHGRCDKPEDTNISDTRPCTHQYACHHIPWGDSAAVANTASEVDRMLDSAHAVSMMHMTRREVMERALSWVASGYEYKWCPVPLINFHRVITVCNCITQVPLQLEPGRATNHATRRLPPQFVL
jgi:hypothetical protein